MQDLLVKLYPKLEQLKVVEQLRPWLTRALYYQCVDNARHRARTALGHCNDLSDVDGDCDMLDTFPGQGFDPEDAAEQALFRERLQAAFFHLSGEHRTVVALHDIEGYGLDELTALLEVPVGTLKSRLHRAHRHLRTLLYREPETPDWRVYGQRGVLSG